MCGCLDAWDSLAYSLELPGIHSAEELTLPVVRAAAGRFVGRPLRAEQLPETGDPCVLTAEGATCEWRIWERGGAYKGYVARFLVSPATGRITRVSVGEHVWPKGSA